MPSMKALVAGGITVIVAMIVYDKFVRGRI